MSLLAIALLHLIQSARSIQRLTIL